MEPEFHINQRLSFTPGQAYTAARCTVRYSGPVDGTTGTWLGVEWDVEGKGKHSGVHGGKKYFECKAPGNASFIRTTRQPDDTLSFLEGLRRKYTTADDPPDAHAVLSLTANKVFEEVGFEKIQKKLGQLKELKIVILDGLCLARADAREEITETCPNLTYNHVPTFPQLDALPALFPQLTSIRLSHNPFCALLPREEAHMLTLARLPEHVSMLNHTRVLPAERQNAEMYYLGRIAKELAAVGESEEEEVLKSHGRWGVLCELYGAPRIDRAVALEKRCLGSRLVKVEFVNGEKKVVRGVPTGMAGRALSRLLATRSGFHYYSQ